MILIAILFSFSINEIAGFRLHHSGAKLHVPKSRLKPLHDTNPESDGTSEFMLVGDLDNKVDSDTTVSLELLSANERMELYFGDFKKGKQIQSSAKWLRTANEMGRSILNDAGTPKAKEEAWRYNNVKKIFSYPYETKSSAVLNMTKVKEEVSIYIDSSCNTSNLVFIDGVYSPSLSSQAGINSSSGVIVSAMSSQLVPSSIIDILGHIPDEDEFPRDSFGSDLLTGLNLGYLEDAAVIDIPFNVTSTPPVQVLFLSTASLEHPSASFPRLIVQLGDFAELHLKETHLTISANDSTVMSHSDKEQASDSLLPTLVNGNTRVVIGRNASCTHVYDQALSKEARSLEVMSSSVQGSGSYELTVLQMGAMLGRVNVHIDLEESLSNGTLNGITLASARQSLDLHSSITHDAEATLSRQQQRNVIAEKGEAIFKGRIRIPKHAQLTDSDQMCRSIMTGGDDNGGKAGRLIAMPTLEIAADDVTASHGASVSDIDETSMFYLGARGISRKVARKLLLKGFIFGVLVSKRQKVMDQAAQTRVMTKLDSLSPVIDKVVKDPSQKYTSM
jgi:Fe-S cluster assembly protein SufD